MKHEPVEMKEVDSYEEHFMKQFTSISTYQCPICKRYKTEFTKEGIFHPETITCFGTLQEQETAVPYEQDETPF